MATGYVCGSISYPLIWNLTPIVRSNGWWQPYIMNMLVLVSLVEIKTCTAFALYNGSSAYTIRRNYSTGLGFDQPQAWCMVVTMYVLGTGLQMIKVKTRNSSFVLSRAHQLTSYISHPDLSDLNSNIALVKSARLVTTLANDRLASSTFIHFNFLGEMWWNDSVYSMHSWNKLNQHARTRWYSVLIPWADFCSTICLENLGIN